MVSNSLGLHKNTIDEVIFNIQRYYMYNVYHMNTLFKKNVEIISFYYFLLSNCKHNLNTILIFTLQPFNL